MNLFDKKMNVQSIYLAIAAVFLFFMAGLATGNDENNDVLRDAVINGIKSNISNLNSAFITWRSETISHGAWSDKIGTEDTYQIEKGTRQLWWDGNKIAVNARSDTLNYGEGKQTTVDTHQIRMAYDGKVFRTKSPRPSQPEMSDVALFNEPRFNRGDNYLRDIGWDNLSGPLKRFFMSTIS